MATENTNIRIEQILSRARAIYIIDGAGLLLHHEYFLDQKEDPDLYAGLFSAVAVYAKELNAGAISNIGLEDHKFIFLEHSQTGNLIIIEVFNDVSTEDGAWFLEQIIKRFEFMDKLMSEDVKGTFSLETLFDERGKTINWSVIQSIREDALEDQLKKFDKVETLNLARVNVSNKFWVKLRKICTSLVENQKGLSGMLIYINHKEHINKLYAGRVGKENMSKLMNFIEKKFYDGIVGLELETEYIQIDDEYIGIFNMLCADGALLCISSIDKFLITNRLTQQIERLVMGVEKLAPQYNL
ncbi:MAG: hypothetical protein INQ03_08810 [Candidatus Heimdallarchaeota archaeon]|nr:hypothetical protein [Candidatus Heimdallarchaeota archaeon]